MLGTRTWGSRTEGADESIELMEKKDVVIQFKNKAVQHYSVFWSLFANSWQTDPYKKMVFL